MLRQGGSLRQPPTVALPFSLAWQPWGVPRGQSGSPLTQRCPMGQLGPLSIAGETVSLLPRFSGGQTAF